MSAADMVAAALEKSYRASDIPWSQLTSLQGKRDRLLCSCLREKLPWAPSLDSSRNTPARDALSALARAVKRNEGALLVLFADGGRRKVNDGGGRQSTRGRVMAGNSRMGY